MERKVRGTSLDLSEQKPTQKDNFHQLEDLLADFEIWDYNWKLQLEQITITTI